MTKNNPAKAELAKLLSIKADAMRASGDLGSANLLYEAADTLACPDSKLPLGQPTVGGGRLRPFQRWSLFFNTHKQEQCK